MDRTQHRTGARVSKVVLIFQTSARAQAYLSSRKTDFPFHHSFDHALRRGCIMLP